MPTHRPGWYPDPQNPAFVRWWDGFRWTHHAQPAPQAQQSRATADPAPSRRWRASPASPAAPVVQPPPGSAPSNPAAPDSTSNAAAALTAEHQELLNRVIELRDVALLQEVGLYEYSHPVDSSADYKDKLKELQDEFKRAAKAGKAIHKAATWSVNGSTAEGARMVSDLSKLMLRAYNNEVDNAVRSMKPYGLEAAKKRVELSRSTISKHGQRMQIYVSDSYHRLRIVELELTADYLAKLAEEKEAQREERERLKEERAARKEFEREQARLEKERSHYQSALEQLVAKGDAQAIEEAKEKLAEIADAIDGVVERAANSRAGYVYVISNLGSFGERVVKIGMTRRLDPYDRVRELGDASVPFKFDVHAIVFSDDAVGLEAALHREFAEFRVNLANLRREYFFVRPAAVRDALNSHGAHLLSFTEEPEALEWHQTENMRRNVAMSEFSAPASTAMPSDLPPPTASQVL